MKEAMEAADNSKVDVGADAGTQKTFTQEEVNSIVQERLARERAKNEPTPLELKEMELTARENAMLCREYIAEKKYPTELLEFFDTTDPEDFKKKIDRLHEVFEIVPKKSITTSIVGTGVTFGVNLSDNSNPIAEAFRRK